MHLLDQLYVGNPACEIAVDPGKSTAEELFRSLPGFLKGGRGYDHPEANHLVIDRNEPGPVEFLLIKDQCVAFRVLTRRATVADNTSCMSKKDDLLIVLSAIFGPCHPLVCKK